MTPFLLLAAALAAPPDASARPAKPSKEADERKAFFDAGKVLDLKVELDKDAVESLRKDPRKYVKCTLKEGDTTYPDVAVHLRGAVGSFQGVDQKPGLTFNMDKFNDGQRFHGMDKFHLCNANQDPSYLSEFVCGELFRAAGIPASRIGHAAVSVAGRNRGFYYLKEGYDKGFLKIHFGTSHGNLYDGGFLKEIDQDAQLVSGKDDVKDRADLKALAAAAREKDPKVRLQKLDKLIDVDQFTTYMVLETILWDWDGYPFKKNNYRMYHDPAKNKITFIPSGMDQMLHDPNGTIHPGFEGLIAQALLNTPEGKAKYDARLRSVMKDLYKPEALVKRLDELEARIRPALKAADKGAADNLKGQVDRLRNGFVQRQKSIAEQVAREDKEAARKEKERLDREAREKKEKEDRERKEREKKAAADKAAADKKAAEKK